VTLARAVRRSCMGASEAERAEIFTIARRGEGWPEELASVDAAPERLWGRGARALLAPAPRIAIVGSRAPTAYGLAQAERFASALSARGVVVVSGLARGIDAAAHEGALGGPGGTIAVLGCGVDRPWPSGRLADRVAREGLLLSEFPPGVGPRRHHFPLRNRLIAALSDAVLVVEAAEASGSLITARWAAEQGQDVFALPGRVDHPMARGTLRLVREGATPVGSPEMLVEDLWGLGAPWGTGGGRAGPDPAASRTPAERAALDALVGETLSAGEVASRAGLEIGEALAALTTLSFDGLVRRGPGGLYTRAPA